MVTMFTPDKELIDIWDAELWQPGWLRTESIKVHKRIRSDKLKREASSTKKQLIEEKGACEICGFSFKPVLQIHHILPISKCGNNAPENIICVCPTCHKTLHYMYSCWKSEKFEDFYKTLGSPMFYDKDANWKMYDTVKKYINAWNEVCDYRNSVWKGDK